MVSCENAVELTEIILGYFGLNTGLFSKITSTIQLGKNIIAENKLTDKQKFIKTMESSIYSFLSIENVTDDVIEKLKDTLQNHLDLQELMHHYGDHGGFCELLAETQYSKQEQDSDNSFSAYFTTLSGIVEAIFNHLNLFEVGSNASIAALQKLCNYNEMCRLYGEKLNENNYLLNYRGSFAEYIDSVKLLPKLKTSNKFSYLHSAIKFYGRKDECAAIQEFLEQDKRISIWAITGPGGIGKSKFARHIAETYQHKMGVVWLTDDEFTKISLIVNTNNNICYDRPILFICDYAASKSEKLNNLIEKMSKMEYKVRFLLLERSSAWYYGFLNEHNYANEYKYIGINDAAPINLSYSVFTKNEYYNILDDFSRANYQTIIENNDKDQIIAYAEGLSTDSTQRMKSARCLFLLLAADAYLTHTDTHTLHSWDENALLINYINHSKKLLKDRYSAHTIKVAYRILALATALGGLDLEETYSTGIQSDIDDLTISLDNDCSAVSALFSELSEKTVDFMTAASLLPDIIGEFLFINELQSLSKKTKQEWFTLIYEREYGRSFLARSIADWDTEKNIIRKYMIDNRNTNSVHSAKTLCDAVLELHEFKKAQKILESMEEMISNEPEILEQYTFAITYMIDMAEYEEQRRFCLEKIERLTEAEIILKEDSASSNTYSNIARIFYEMGVYKRALNYYQNALTINEKVLGLEHPDTATSYNNIAGVYKNMGDYDTALEFYQKALAITEKVLGLEHPSTAITYYNISVVYLESKNYTIALTYLQKAYSIFKEKLGKNHAYMNTIAKKIKETKQKLQNSSTT